MFELSVNLDLRNIARFRTLLSANRKIAAQSLSFTAERAQKAWIVGNHVFYRRNKWIDKGVRITHATPGNLNARVGSIDKFMGRHVEGVDDPKVGGAKDLFVPLDMDHKLTHTRLRSKIKAMFSTQRKPFWIMSHGKRMLVRREGKARSGLIVLGEMLHEVHIKARLDAVGIVDAAVQREFPTVYERLLLKWAESN